MILPFGLEMLKCVPGSELHLAWVGDKWCAVVTVEGQAHRFVGMGEDAVHSFHEALKMLRAYTSKTSPGLE